MTSQPTHANNKPERTFYDTRMTGPCQVAGDSGEEDEIKASTTSSWAGLKRAPPRPALQVFLLLARLDGETSVGKFNKREKSARVELRGSGK